MPNRVGQDESANERGLRACWIGSQHEGAAQALHERGWLTRQVELTEVHEGTFDPKPAVVVLDLSDICAVSPDSQPPSKPVSQRHDAVQMQLETLHQTLVAFGIPLVVIASQPLPLLADDDKQSAPDPAQNAQDLGVSPTSNASPAPEQSPESTMSSAEQSAGHGAESCDNPTCRALRRLACATVFTPVETTNLVVTILAAVDTNHVDHTRDGEVRSDTQASQQQANCETTSGRTTGGEPSDDGRLADASVAGETSAGAEIDPSSAQFLAQSVKAEIDLLLRHDDLGHVVLSSPPSLAESNASLSSNPPVQHPSVEPDLFPSEFSADLLSGPTELSPELQRLLEEAEKQDLSRQDTSDSPSPQQQVDAVLPPEILAALDEPLALSENDSDSSSVNDVLTPDGGSHVSEGSTDGSKAGLAAGSANHAAADASSSKAAASSRLTVAEGAIAPSSRSIGLTTHANSTAGSSTATSYSVGSSSIPRREQVGAVSDQGGAPARIGPPDTARRPSSLQQPQASSPANLSAVHPPEHHAWSQNSLPASSSGSFGPRQQASPAYHSQQQSPQSSPFNPPPQQVAWQSFALSTPAHPSWRSLPTAAPGAAHTPLQQSRANQFSQPVGSQMVSQMIGQPQAAPVPRVPQMPHVPQVPQVPRMVHPTPAPLARAFAHQPQYQRAFQSLLPSQAHPSMQAPPGTFSAQSHEQPAPARHTPRRPSLHPQLPHPPVQHSAQHYSSPQTGHPFEQPAAPQDAARSAVALPQVLTPEFDGLHVLAVCIAERVTGTLCFEYEDGLSRAVMRDGDFITCGSSADNDTLLAFLMLRGDLPKDVGAQLVGRTPPFGRHAVAALIANGYVRQDQLWTVLRAHAEWLLGKMATINHGPFVMEPQPPGRLASEPGVFGGATGAEVLIEVTQRVVTYDQAIKRLGSVQHRVTLGPQQQLLGECALSEQDYGVVKQLAGHTIAEALEASTRREFASLLVALHQLGVIEVIPSIVPANEPAQGASDRDLLHAPRDPAQTPGIDELDAQAVRQRIGARIAIVQQGDYFEVLGVAKDATGYEIRRAYLEARRAFEPSRILTAETVDLTDDARLIVQVLDEAYDLLRDDVRRARYTRALMTSAPSG